MELGQFFKKGDLIPAIVQEKSTGQVLMLAYMNRESLEKTLATGYTWFYSRSRKALWNKGETSGHRQKVLEMYYDCDEDTILAVVEQTGPACHTGGMSYARSERPFAVSVSIAIDVPRKPVWRRPLFALMLARRPSIVLSRAAPSTRPSLSAKSAGVCMSRKIGRMRPSGDAK